MMDPIEMLIDGAVQHQVLQNRNPYLTMETIILRLYNKIHQHTRVLFSQMDKTVLFSQWHEEILAAYEVVKLKLNSEERASVERVLSKDCPLPNELSKFASCWFKYDAAAVCRWFAVDGILGSNPKDYVNDAFSTKFERHNNAVRVLYHYSDSPQRIKEIVEKAFAVAKDEPCASDVDPEFEKCVQIYAEMVGPQEMERVASDRRTKSQQKTIKRRKKNQPVSPVDSPQNF